MESCGPHHSRSAAVSSTSREPKTTSAALSNNGTYREDGASRRSSGASEESVKGVARLASLRFPAGSSDGASSIVIAAVKQLEQRLECEHRHTERQFQRLERQVEELTKVPQAGGRWAELQGYVDGLAETVQTLVKRNEEASMGASAQLTSTQVTSTSVAACGDHAALTALRMRVDGLEDRQAQGEKTRDVKIKEQHLHVCEQLQGLADRLLETEQSLARILATSRSSAAEAIAAVRENDRRDAAEWMHSRDIEERLEPREATSITRIYEELASFAARLEAAESAINGGSTQSIVEAGAQHDEDFGSATNSQFFEAEELQDQVDELRSRADEQLDEMREHLQDLEGRLQDLQLDHDVRQEASHVGEQVFRLAMRMQRLENHGTSNTVSIEEARELHAELGDVSEQILHLSSRLTHAERGLSGMAEGFDRICEEFASFRAERSVDDGGEQASYESPEKQDTIADTKPADPIHHKVREMERSHDTMAEVVWQLKKEVTGLRNELRQTSITGDDVIGSGVHSQNTSPGNIGS